MGLKVIPVLISDLTVGNKLTFLFQGGLIAKRLLAYPSTTNRTNIAIALAAPLLAPVINFDPIINNYYMVTNLEWENYVNQYEEIKEKKFLISIGSGPRDVLIPAGLTSSNNSHIGALVTIILQ